jgi:hypothetical protein
MKQRSGQGLQELSAKNAAEAARKAEEELQRRAIVVGAPLQ